MPSFSEDVALDSLFLPDGRVGGGLTLYQVVASDCNTSYDDLQKFLSDDFIPHCGSDSSDDGEDCERHFFPAGAPGDPSALATGSLGV